MRNARNPSTSFGYDGLLPPVVQTFSSSKIEEKSKSSGDEFPTVIFLNLS